MRVVALIPAAGSSQRMGAQKPKTLLELGGITILERTVRAVSACHTITQIVVLSREEEIQEVTGLLHNYTKVSVVAGGSTRQESVKRGLGFISQSSLGIPDFVLVHDAARCLVSSDLINGCVSEAIKTGAVTAAVPMIDSVKEVNANRHVARTVDRTNLWAVQTPQVFSYDILFKAHELSTPGATDDASLVEPFHVVTVVPGERSNLKITTPEDLVVAEALLGNRH